MVSFVLQALWEVGHPVKPASVCLGVWLAVALVPLSAAATAPNGDALMQKAVAANNADWEAQPKFAYRATETRFKLDESNHIQGRQSKTHEVIMLEGSPYRRLISVDGEPLSPELRRSEQQRYAAEAAKRQWESAGDRNSRLSKFRGQRAEEHLLMEQMVSAFHFHLIDEQQVGGVDCLHFNAIPNPDYRPPVEKARVLTGMRGQIWIERGQFHWVKVEADVTKPVEFGFILAKVNPGTSFELEQEPVGNVWLPKRFVESVQANVLGFYSYRSKTQTDYSDYSENQVAAATALEP